MEGEKGYDEKKGYRDEREDIKGRREKSTVPAHSFLFFCLSLSHTHTHTHTHSLAVFPAL